MRFANTELPLTIELPNEVALRMRELSITAGVHETGGIVIGQYDESRFSAMIRLVSPAPKDSTAGTAFFHRGVRGIDALLKRQWKSGFYYLGEWHFHPEAAPRASTTDALQMARFAHTESMRCPEPLLLIIGRPEDGSKIAAHIFRERLVLLDRVPESVAASDQLTK